jgi:hypothetical protein
LARYRIRSANAADVALSVRENCVDQDTLAENAVDLIAATFRGAPGEIGKSMLRLVAGQLSLSGDGDTLADLRRRPHDEDVQVTLAAAILDEMRSDPVFRRGVFDLVSQVATEPAAGGVHVNTTTATRGGVAVTNTGGTVNILSKKVNFGGLSVSVGTLVLAGVVVLGLGGWGLSAVSGSGPSVSGTTTCREWLGLDYQTQSDVMKKLYLAADKPNRAADPFIVENTQYACGSRPDNTLNQLVAAGL